MIASPPATIEAIQLHRSSVMSQAPFDPLHGHEPMLYCPSKAFIMTNRSRDQLPHRVRHLGGDADHLLRRRRRSAATSIRAIRMPARSPIQSRSDPRLRCPLVDGRDSGRVPNVFFMPSPHLAASVTRCSRAVFWLPAPAGAAVKLPAREEQTLLVMSRKCGSGKAYTKVVCGPGNARPSWPDALLCRDM